MKPISELITNEIEGVGQRAQFAAILGENPSQGARSPLLWNAAFDELGIPCEMLAFDVSVDNLDDLLEVLDTDKRFIGGAVAVPHKETIAQWLSRQEGQRLSPEATAIGAVNSLYRNAEGVLCATNTDGEGALVSLLQHYPDLSGKRVLLIGPGGAGKAVAAFVKRAIGSSGILTITGRNQEAGREFSQKIDAHYLNWPPAEDIFAECDVVINCSTVGSGIKVETQGALINLIEYSPLTFLDEKNLDKTRTMLEKIPATGLVFDIIYDPSPTCLLKVAEDVGLSVLGGGEMNLEQAVLAFQYAINDTTKVKHIRAAMDKVRSAF